MTTEENKNLLRRLEEELLQPKIRRNPDRVRELLANEFREITSAGIEFDKAQVLDSLKNEPEIQRSLSGFKITELVPDVVLATYTLAKGAPQIQSLRSSIWKYKEGRWQMIFHQGTLRRGQRA